MARAERPATPVMIASFRVMTIVLSERYLRLQQIQFSASTDLSLEEGWPTSPYDFLCLHSRCRPAYARLASWRGNATDAGHGGVCGDARRDDFRNLPHACFLCNHPQVREAVKFSPGQGCLVEGILSEQYGHQPRNNQRDRPGKIKIEPRALQDADTKFFIDDHRDETRHEQVPERVDDDGGSGEPGMIQEIKIRPV